ncbi:MAG: thioredoxin family protein [Rikenellaceae bacterium]
MIRKITLAALLLVAAIAANTTAATAQVKFHTGDTSTLYKESRAGDKLIFIDLYASWCPPCKAMDRDVFSRKDVGDFMSKNFISAKYSVDEGIGAEFSRSYNVRSIPTYLIFNSEGVLVAQMAGAMSHTEFITNMTSIIEQAK